MIKNLKYGFILAASGLSLSFSLPSSTYIAKEILKANNVNEKIYITFDANGGTLKGNKLLEFETNTEFKHLKNVPEVSRDGVITSPGWIDASTKEIITENTTFTTSTTLKANWKLYNVTFNGNGGLIEGKDSKSFKDVTIIHSDDIKAPFKENYTFTGWKEEGSSDYITFPYKPTKNVNINACYTNDEYVTIAFAANGGKFIDGKFTGGTFAYTNVKFGTSWKDIINKDLLPFKDPEINGDLVFSTWKLNNNEISEDYKFYSSTLLKADYVDGIQITFDVSSNGGTWADGSTSSIVTPKLKLASNPTLKNFKDSIQYTIPKKGNIELLGWFDNKDADGEKLNLDETSVPITNKKSFTIYAYYKDINNVTFTLNEGVTTKEEYSKNFVRKDNLTYVFKENQGYTLSENQIIVKFGGNTKTKGIDYTFSVENGEGTLNIPDAPKENIEIIINSNINTYSIGIANLPAGVSSIDVDGSGTYKEEVNVSVEVLEGYTLSSLKIKNKKTQEEMDITSTKKFTMPDSDVEIIATTTINTYNITKDTTVEGLNSLIVSDESPKYLDTVTVTCTAKSGYTLNGIKVVKIGFPSTIYANINSGESFIMPYYDVIVIPVISINSYELSFDANGGSLTSTTKIDVTYNDCVLNAVSMKSISDPTHDDAAFKGWGESISSQEIITNDLNMPANNKTIYAIWYKYNFEFIDVEHATISGTKSYNGLYKLSSSDFISSTTITPSEGYSFTGNYEIYIDNEESSRLTTDFTSSLKPGKLSNPIKKDATIKIKPIITINSYKVSFNYNGGSVKKDNNPIYFLNLNYGDNILNNLNGINATHDYKVFKGWQMIKEDGTTSIIDETTSIPSCNITIKPLWKTSNIVLSATNGVITGESSFEDKVIFYDREGFDITPNTGYEFHHYEYSFNNTNFTKIESLPFKPFVTNPDLEDGTTVYIKAVCVKYINLWLYANDGTFDGGTNYKCISIISGQKWKDVKNDLPTPSKEGFTFDKWVFNNTGKDINDNDVIESTTILKAIYVGGE